MNKTIVIVLAVVAVLVVGGFLLMSGNSSQVAQETTSPTQTPAQTEEAPSGEVSDTVSIETSGFQFAPATIKVKAGGKISYTNKDAVAHTFTADDGESFDSGNVAKDQTVEVTAPSEPGEYPFHCTPHPNMKGTLIVE